MTRKAFADAIGMKPDSFSMYEYARAPLRYDLTHKIFSWFNVNPKWLATGEGPLNLGVVLPSPEALGVSPRELFSSVYDRLLTADVERQIAAQLERLTFEPIWPSTEIKPPLGAQQRVLMEESVHWFLSEFFWRLSADDLAALVAGIVSIASDVNFTSSAAELEKAEARKAEMDAARGFIARRRKEFGIEAP